MVIPPEALACTLCGCYFRAGEDCACGPRVNRADKRFAYLSPASVETVRTRFAYGMTAAILRRDEGKADVG